ncbi:MAG TPA: redoxin domain-containing protein [Steroidobacteraceae bacterium]|nr:redoxin domain-containing protein [Steroidobacteraceae bacterium]
MHSMRLILSIAALLSSAPLAFGSPEIVDNFRLTDQQGTSHELYYLSDMKAVVLLAQGTGCEASQKAAATLEGLRAKYEPQGVTFLLLDSNLQDASSREALAKQEKQAGLSLPILMDETQLVGEALGITRNGEVLIANPQGWKVAYRGGVGAVPAALDSMVSGAAVNAAASAVSGCAIKMPERDKKQAHAQISYEKTIAPMLIDKCVTCHRTGGIGPWQMTSYDMVKGFAPMIREVVRVQRMPPMPIDRHYNAFSNDRGLSTEQARTLVHWIEAGAPRGTGADPLLAQKKDWPEWPLGKPDLIVELPAFTVPATGTIPYQMTKVENPLDHDVWVRAIDWVPGERTVVHHIIASAGGAERRGAVSLNNYVPGVEPLELPPEAGILLPAHATFHFQTHYTSNGKALTDQTRMGLYFRKDAPKYNFRSLVFANPKLRIPPNTKWHEEVAENTLKEDAILYTLHPHAHYRGKASRFVAYYPNGKEETLLNIPAYDFNWQGTYEMTKPLQVPAGTRIVYTQWYDNSTQNKANPDANREVTWGEQTWDEMIFGVIRYRNVTEDAKSQPQQKGPSQEELFTERQARQE